MSIEIICKKCHKVFESKNKLHKHLKQACAKATNEYLIVIRFATKTTAVNFVKRANQVVVAESSNVVSSSIVMFKISTEDLRYELDFRSWNYLTAKVTLNSTILSDFTIDCLNTECEFILIDREWLRRLSSNVVISKMIDALKMRDIESFRHSTKNYTTISLYFLATNLKNKVILASITRELYIVDELRANVLIDTDIIESEEIVLDVTNQKTYIINCDVTISINAKQRDSFTRRNLHAATQMIIQSNINVFISIQESHLSKNREFLFEFLTQSSIVLYTHIVNHEIKKVMTKNISLM